MGMSYKIPNNNLYCNKSFLLMQIIFLFTGKIMDMNTKKFLIVFIGGFWNRLLKKVLV